MKTVLFFCLCALSLSCRTGSETAFAEVPLESCSGVPCVAVSLDGGPSLRLVLDLQNQSSHISIAAARKAKLRLANVNRLRMGSLVLDHPFFAVNSADIPLAAPRDGSLSYSAFGDRLVIFDMPHHRLRVSVDTHGKFDCHSGCGTLIQANEGEIVLRTILAAKGFAVNGEAITAAIDPGYTGAIIAVQPIGFDDFRRVTPTTASYWGEPLLLLHQVRVTFGGRTLADPAPLVRVDQAFGLSGRTYQGVVGLSLLSKHTFAFDFRNMVMWLDDSSKA